MDAREYAVKKDEFVAIASIGLGVRPSTIPSIETSIAESPVFKKLKLQRNLENLLMTALKAPVVALTTARSRIQLGHLQPRPMRTKKKSSESLPKNVRILGI